MEVSYKADSTGVAFEGDTNEVIVVHVAPVEIGTFMTVGGVRVQITRESSKDEYLERCWQAPKLPRADHYHFYAGVLA